MDALAKFLRAETRRPFSWAEGHCVLMGADWAHELTGRDPAAPWRGAWSNEDQARAIVVQAGGLQALIDKALTDIGARRHAHAVRGDIGLIVVTGPEGRTEVCGISTGGRWAARSRQGVWIGRAEALAVWTF